jgi:hypothetical protein
VTEVQFLQAVQAYVVAHPEVAPRLMEAARAALLERVQLDAQRAADMETLARVLVDARPVSELSAGDQRLLREKLAANAGRLCFRWDRVRAQLAEKG